MQQDAALTPEQFAAWKPFAAVLELLPANLNSALQRCAGQPLVNLYVLGHLQRQPTRTTGLSDLAACTNSALPRMSRIVAKLEADGYVTRSTCASDARALLVTLTPAGERLLEESMPHHDRVVRQLLIDALTPEQLRQLGEISTVLEARLHPDAAAPIDRQRVLTP